MDGNGISGDLKQLVFLALTRNGVLAKMKAHLEESIFSILEDQDSAAEKPGLPLHKLDEKELTVGLLAECLHWCGLESTAKVLATESGMGGSIPPRPFLANQLGIAAETDAPLLVTLIRSTCGVAAGVASAAGETVGARGKGDKPRENASDSSTSATSSTGEAPGPAAAAKHAAVGGGAGGLSEALPPLGRALGRPPLSASSRGQAPGTAPPLSPIEPASSASGARDRESDGNNTAVEYSEDFDDIEEIEVESVQSESEVERSSSALEQQHTQMSGYSRGGLSMDLGASGISVSDHSGELDSHDAAESAPYVPRSYGVHR